MLGDLSKMSHAQRVASLIGLGQNLQTMQGRLKVIDKELAVLEDAGFELDCRFYCSSNTSHNLSPAKQHQLPLRVAYIAALKEEHKQVQAAMSKMVSVRLEA